MRASGGKRRISTMTIQDLQMPPKELTNRSLATTTICTAIPTNFLNERTKGNPLNKQAQKYVWQNYKN